MCYLEKENNYDLGLQLSIIGWWGKERLKRCHTVSHVEAAFGAQNKSFIGHNGDLSDSVSFIIN